MAAANTDKLKKYKSLFSTTLSTGIGTGTGDTITPASVSGLPTDTAITLTFDRVDSGGVATPTKLERIVGVISGGNFTSYVRGVDGTTEQAHTAGAVIEMIWNADDWNDAVDWGLVQHNQDGTHGAITSTNASMVTASMVTPTINAGKFITSINDANGNEVIKTPATTSAVNEITVTNAATGNSPSVSATGGDDNLDLLLVAKGTGVVKAGGVAVATGTIPVKASGAELTTGTDDAKFATAKAMADAGLNTRLSSKVVTVSKDVSATGDQAITGVGFTPTSIILFLTIGGTKNYSSGICDSTLAERCTVIDYAGNGDYTASYIAFFTTAASQVARAIVKSFDADGFTLTWDKVNSPTGTANGYAICFR